MSRVRTGPAAARRARCWCKWGKDARRTISALKRKRGSAEQSGLRRFERELIRCIHNQLRNGTRDVAAVQGRQARNVERSRATMAAKSKATRAVSRSHIPACLFGLNTKAPSAVVIVVIVVVDAADAAAERSTAATVPTRRGPALAAHRSECRNATLTPTGRIVRGARPCSRGEWPRSSRSGGRSRGPAGSSAASLSPRCWERFGWCARQRLRPCVR